jgi:hypothetical protein
VSALRVAPGVHAREFGDETVLVDVRRGVYFSLDAVGTVVWKAIAEGATLATAVDAVVAAFDVTASVAHTDAEILVAQLREVGLIEDGAMRP